MSQPVPAMPAPAAPAEAAGGASRRAPGARADADGFGAALRGQMPAADAAAGHGDAAPRADAGVRAPAGAAGTREPATVQAASGAAADPAAAATPDADVVVLDASALAEALLQQMDAAPAPAPAASAPMPAASPLPADAAAPASAVPSASPAPGVAAAAGAPDAHAAVRSAARRAGGAGAVPGGGSAPLAAAPPAPAPGPGASVPPAAGPDALDALAAGVREALASGHVPVPARPREAAAQAPSAFALALAPAAGTGAAALPALDAGTAAASVIERPVGDPHWGAALGARLVINAGQGVHGATLALNPRDLGPVQVTLTVSDEQASVNFVAHHAAVRDAIEAALPRLRELFADAGMVLGEVDISAGDGRRGGNGEAAGRDPGATPAAHAEPRDAATSTHAVRLADGLVDTFA